MKITRNVITISDLNQWLEEGTLIINNKYQRAGGLWPKNARSFFIDTILNGFTFPKITIRQTIDLRTRKSVREVVDGQQRLSTIRDFINDDITLSTVSKKYRGYNFSDLDEETQEAFLAYEVSVDTVVTGTTEEVLEIFRRMNSYTLPLNAPEKRHATYQGEFKWFILDLVEKYSTLLEQNKILTLREIARMQDADLFTELSQVVIKGVFSRSAANLEKLYKIYDYDFEDRQRIEDKITNTINFIKDNFEQVNSSGIMTNYLFYSLFSALIYNKFGIENIQPDVVDDLEPINDYCIDINLAIQNIMELFRAIDEKDDTGRYREFVKASSSTTHSLNNRIIRLKWFVLALQNKL
ncbi:MULTISPECIES: DUF262 domain-containing protein [Bacillus]|uniref:DUF262 domain-containing protein n=1 Tax=Bacillus TaxID=1386 RepID=UPI00077A6930|nr:MULTISPECIES: DUF262 domain-containing protein [Bacillus cereus group]KXY70691.1 hypothetical protein AT270_27225 [Bacillus cereus]MBG9937525.1 hypothetical protein [Bacillus tropicus]MED2993814.1 DUF262 domain-containing protein [Bacillus tropicus]OTY56524.1 hypothetical protein BK748_15425 [Bacillus thuringiensis serovar graciosensis]